MLTKKFHNQIRTWAHREYGETDFVLVRKLVYGQKSARWMDAPRLSLLRPGAWASICALTAGYTPKNFWHRCTNNWQVNLWNIDRFHACVQGRIRNTKPWAFGPILRTASCAGSHKMLLGEIIYTCSAHAGLQVITLLLIMSHLRCTCLLSYSDAQPTGVDQESKAHRSGLRLGETFQRAGMHTVLEWSPVGYEGKAREEPNAAVTCLAIMPQQLLERKVHLFSWKWTCSTHSHFMSQTLVIYLTEKTMHIRESKSLILDIDNYSSSLKPFKSVGSMQDMCAHAQTCM